MPLEQAVCPPKDPQLGNGVKIILTLDHRDSMYPYLGLNCCALRPPRLPICRTPQIRFRTVDGQR